MKARYSSFLIRLHVLERGGERIEVEHIQSGRKARLLALDHAATWMRARTLTDARAPPDATNATNAPIPSRYREDPRDEDGKRRKESHNGTTGNARHDDSEG